MTNFLSMCATVKNEALYLEEWLRHHSLQGVEHFYMHDDESMDGSMDILKAWEAAGKATVYSGFRKPDVPPQQAFYDFIAREKKNETQWCAFFDLDEFYQGEKTMSGLLGGLGEAVSAMEISWCHFGSSGLKEYDDRAVVERFTGRAAIEFRYNRFFKTAARLANYASLRNVHAFEYSKGITLNSGMEDMTGLKFPERAEIPACWNSCRLNHYHTKSHAEYLAKLERGRADMASRRPYDFYEFDRNEVCDRSMLEGET